jgi:hypothetical protein
MRKKKLWVLVTWLFRVIYCFLVTCLLLGQYYSQDTQPTPANSPPVTTVLENTGKPIVLPLQCTEEDVTALGLTCSDEEPCAVFLDLTAAESVGAKIFLAGNLHSASVTMFSVLLSSEDGGRTWQEVHNRIRGAGLDSFQFVDADTGWASGELLSPLPREPFLLATSDGGKTWRRRPIFAESAESQLGSIQQFYFSDKTAGSAVIDRGQGTENDRYERYESPDGGAVWTFQQSSPRVIPLRRPADPGPTLRIRADGATRSFRIERQQADRWAPVSAFAVNAPSCKPQ